MSEPPPPLPWNALIRVNLAVLSFFLGFGCLLPIFPLWLQSYTSSQAEVGVITTLAIGIGLILARPLAARAMEGRRRAPTLAIGILCIAIPCALFPFLQHASAIFCTRLVQGLGYGLAGTAALTAVTDLAPAERRGQVMGYFGAINALALLAGPALGAYVARRAGADTAFHLAAALSLMSLVFLPGLLEPPKPKVDRAPLVEALRVPGMVRLALAHFIALLLHSTVVAFLPLRLVEHPGWMSVEGFFAIDAAVLIAFRVSIGRRFDAWGRRLFIGAGLFCLSMAGLALGLADSDPGLATAAVLYGIGMGAYLPAVSARVGDVVPETHRARGFAVFLLAYDLAVACGGAIFGPLIDVLGVATSLWIAGLVPLLAAAIHLVPLPTRTPVVRSSGS